MGVFPGAIVSDANLGLAANGAQSTLNGAINNAVGTITVLDTSSFASTGYIVIDTEVVNYASKNATQFLGCTRASDGSAAASHSSGANVYGYVVAAHVTNLQSEVKAIETLLGNNTQHVDLTGRPGFGTKYTSADGTKTVIVGVDNNGNFGIIG